MLQQINNTQPLLAHQLLHFNNNYQRNINDGNRTPIVGSCSVSIWTEYHKNSFLMRIRIIGIVKRDWMRVGSNFIY